jgi:hypothetical protein
MADIADPGAVFAVRVVLLNATVINASASYPAFAAALPALVIEIVVIIIRVAHGVFS